MHGVQFYARGMFASPAIGWCSSRKDAGLLSQLQKGACALSAVLHSSLDWPIRRLSQGNSCVQSVALHLTYPEVLITWDMQMHILLHCAKPVLSFQMSLAMALLYSSFVRAHPVVQCLDATGCKANCCVAVCRDVIWCCCNCCFLAMT